MTRDAAELPEVERICEQIWIIELGSRRFAVAPRSNRWGFPAGKLRYPEDWKDYFPRAS